MAREFKETAHLKTNLKDYGENYDRIFGNAKKSLEDNEAEFYKVSNEISERLKQEAEAYGFSFQLSIYQTLGEGYFRIFVNEQENERLHTAWLIKGTKKCQDLLEDEFERLKKEKLVE